MNSNIKELRKAVENIDYYSITVENDLELVQDNLKDAISTIDELNSQIEDLRDQIIELELQLKVHQENGD